MSEASCWKQEDWIYGSSIGFDSAFFRYGSKFSLKNQGGNWAMVAVWLLAGKRVESLVWGAVLHIL